MLRVFTSDIKDAAGAVRWRKGQVSSDYPTSTWEQISRSLGLSLDAFSKPVEALPEAFIISSSLPPVQPGVSDTPSRQESPSAEDRVSEASPPQRLGAGRKRLS